MTTRAFIWLAVAVGTVGAVLGGGAYALFGGNDPTPTLAFSGEDQASDGQEAPEDTDLQPNAAPGDTVEGPLDGGQDGGGGQGGGGGGGFGGGGFGGGGLPIETISGTIASITAEGVTLTTATGPVEVPLAPDTPVQLSLTGDEAAGAINAGDQVRAVLNRDADGNVVAQNITIGGGGGRGGFGGGGGGGGGFGGGGTGDGFNILAGTVASVGNGTFVLETTEGSVDVTLTDETTVSVTTPFAEAGDDLDIGGEVTAIGRRGEDGKFEAITLTTGGGFGGFQFGGGGGRRGGGGGGGQDGGGDFSISGEGEVFILPG